MGLVKITLAKSLNYKNRLVGDKDRLFRLFSQTNSRREDAKSNYDAKEMLEQYEAVVDKLTAVKTAVAKANVAIYEKIYKISELKSKAAQLRQVNTNDKDEEIDRTVRGKDGNYETETKVLKHVAHLNDVAMDKKIKAIEKEIETLHDEVTAFNYQTTVEVPE